MYGVRYHSTTCFTSKRWVGGKGMLSDVDTYPQQTEKLPNTHIAICSVDVLDPNNALGRHGIT